MPDLLSENIPDEIKVEELNGYLERIKALPSIV